MQHKYLCTEIPVPDKDVFIRYRFGRIPDALGDVLSGLVTGVQSGAPGVSFDVWCVPVRKDETLVIGIRLRVTRNFSVA
jgi:hypothetical protein